MGLTPFKAAVLPIPYNGSYILSKRFFLTTILLLFSLQRSSTSWIFLLTNHSFIRHGLYQLIHRHSYFESPFTF